MDDAVPADDLTLDAGVVKLVEPGVVERVIRELEAVSSEGAGELGGARVAAERRPGSRTAFRPAGSPDASRAKSSMIPTAEVGIDRAVRQERRLARRRVVEREHDGGRPRGTSKSPRTYAEAVIGR